MWSFYGGDNLDCSILESCTVRFQVAVEVSEECYLLDGGSNFLQMLIIAQERKRWQNPGDHKLTYTPMKGLVFETRLQCKVLSLTLWKTFPLLFRF